MSDKDPAKLKPNRPKLSLHVPEPPFRPGDTPDFSSLKLPAAGSAPRPDTSVPAVDTHPLTTDLVRVLGDDYKAVGPWDPKLDPDTLRKMLRNMVTVRIFDDRPDGPGTEGRRPGERRPPARGRPVGRILAPHADRRRRAYPALRRTALARAAHLTERRRHAPWAA